MAELSEIQWSEVAIAYTAKVDDAELMVNAVTPSTWRWEIHRPGYHEVFGDFDSKEKAMASVEDAIARRAAKG